MFKLSKLFKAADKTHEWGINKFVLFDADKKSFIYTNAHILVILPAWWVNIDIEAVTTHLLIPFAAIHAADKCKLSVLTDAGLTVDGAVYDVFPAKRNDHGRFINYEINEDGKKVEQFTYPNYEAVLPGERTESNSTPVHFIGLDIKYIRIISEFFESGLKSSLPVKFMFDSHTRAAVLDCHKFLPQNGWELPFVILMHVMVDA